MIKTTTTGLADDGPASGTQAVHRFGQFVRYCGTSIGLLLVLFSLSASRSAATQKVISAKSGYVSRIWGRAFVLRTASNSLLPAEVGLQMTDGDQLITDERSRAKILINSGAFLRLDERTGICTADTRLTATRFELLRGMVMIQTGNPILLLERADRNARQMDSRIPFDIATPHGILTIVDRGLYRIMAGAAAADIDVYEGKIAVRSRTEGRTSATVIKGGNHVQLTNQDREPPIVTPIKLRPFDTFDPWAFPIVKHGVACRVEGSVEVSSPLRNQGRLRRMYSNYQLREGESVFTGTGSYAEFKYGRAAFLRVNQESQLLAIAAESEDAVFQLRQGAVIIESTNRFPLRPVRILTENESFSAARDVHARIDVTGRETVVTVWRGAVHREATRDSEAQGRPVAKGMRLRVSESQGTRLETLRAERPDLFDTWSSGAGAVAYISKSEGKVFIVRRWGTPLALDEDMPAYGIPLFFWVGDRLVTQQGGRATMNFGTDLSVHVNEQSEIAAEALSEQTWQLDLREGAMILYNQMFGKSRGVIGKAATTHAAVDLSGDGEFRFDADSSGTTIQVRSGSLLVQPLQEGSAKAAFDIRQNQAIHLAPAKSPSVYRYLSLPDHFDEWSRKVHLGLQPSKKTD